ncbi:ATP-binding protein [Saccharopolyspora elongata]|uniref:ATP-binding protein n=1 Tax=Saccharopolyspora elongata TaxID=2530387 RepID=A0A4R4Y287_9PSEU|nr:ATP-binding protein [Saccharopolyspora elongata]
MTVYRSTTSDIGGLWPFLVSHGVPVAGARIGYDTLSGSSFYCSPIDWVLRSLVANPNLIVFGEPGQGKSSTVVAFLLRMMLFGVRSLVSGDVKGEYSPVARALGCEPIILGSGMTARVNALDLGPLASRWDGFTAAQQREAVTGLLGRWVQLLTALAEAQGHRVDQTDEMVLAAILRRLTGIRDGNTNLTPVTIPGVHAQLARPDEQLWRDTRFGSERQFLDHLRGITDTLGNLISGPLAGLFDAPTNIRLDWDAPIQTMDLSRLKARGDQAVGVALTVLGSWSATATDLQPDGDIRIVIRDEVWRQMRLGLKAVQAVDSDIRLSRREKQIQILVLHKPSDLLTVGDAGSQEAAIARELMALCSTRILAGQSTHVASELAEALGLGEEEHRQITGWAMERRGRALWKLENRPGFKVQTVLSHVERRLFDTNAQLRRGRR